MNAAILGAVQGIAEFLPISSSAHLVIASELLQQKSMPLVVNISLHLGTTTAVLAYFWKDWWNIGTATLGLRKSSEDRRMMGYLVVGSIPAGVIGILYQDKIEALFHHPPSTIAPLALGGILLWACDRWMPSNRGLHQLSIKDAITIGVAQAIALIPGVSRSGITMTAARTLGINKSDAARFSFLLGTPAMLGAALINYKDILEGATQAEFYVGFVSSMVVGMLAIGFLMRFLKRFSFLSFAIYRLLLAAGIYFLFA